ncbi:MAG TPA: zinc ABC transporter substrate-binding protein [Thermodesulfobacteriota bacterium]|mgnify:CR=1 FL=1|nr:zinc ABC transporter substrate-binding protein [Thermodesulfobacteriota bacterium]
MEFRSLLTIFALTLGFVATGLAGCSSDKAGKEKRTGVMDVVATTGMIADTARVVGGDHVKVTGLMGPGVDPHLYKASAGDVETLSRADIILYNGLHLEGKMSEVFEQMEKRGIRTVAVTDSINRGALISPPEFGGNYDPHVWFDVSLWMKAVEVVRDSLSEADPENADAYGANAAAYLAELGELDEYVKTKAAQVPESKRVLITAHDAFNYFGRAYGFEVRGLQGISTASEAGTADVQALATFIVERKIPVIFVESSVPPKYIEAVQAAAGARGFNVKVGGSLYSDALGNPGSTAGTYAGMVRENIDTITGALMDGGQS